MHYFIRKFWNVVSVIVILTMSVAAVSKAATVTSANDVPSTLETGAGANHTLVFTTLSGAAGSETITLRFDSSFDTSSITEDDVDVEDDGVDLTTAADCSGAEQAAVAILDDVATIEICLGDSGDIAPGSEVTVKIGTNATSSGTGSNQIVNPSSVGTYYLSIAGTFGDSGSIALPMLETGSISVTADVSGGGGGDGGGGCGDTTTPVVSSILVSGTTSSEATITWSTDESASSIVDYGTTVSYEVGSESDSSLVSTHSVSLSGLTEGQEYHFRVRSSDVCGNQATSSDETFITSDETAPVISDIVAEAASTTSVTITWTTDEPTTSTVNYGTTTGYGDTSSEATLTTEHSVTITGLEPGTEYHFEIVSEDASGNAATSSDETVTTDSGAVTNVSGVSVTDGDGSATLSWTNPTDDAFAGVLILMCTDAYPSDESDPDCETVYDGSDTTTTVSGLTNGTTYYFGFFAYDNEGQFASGALATGTPSATEEEVPTSEEEPPAATPPEGGTTDTAGTGTTDTGATGTTDTAGTTETTTETGGETPDEVPAGGTTEEGTPEIPPTSVSGEDIVPMGDVSFFVANRLIQLAPTSSGVVRMLSNRPLRVSLLSKDITKQVSRVQFVLADGAYLMARSADGSSYDADVSSPGSSGTYATAVSIYYVDGTAQSINFAADVVDDGSVYATTEDGQTHAVGGATVTLLANGTVTWDGSPYGQFNPMTTGNDAQYGWYVPNTTYVLSVAASGYSTASSTTFSVTDHIVNRAIPVEALSMEPTPPSSPIASVSNIVAAAGTVAEFIRDNPGVQATAAASTPALAIATSVATVALAASFDLLPFLQYIFSAPFLFFWRRKRRAFGIVYNSISKAPIDLATVRIYRMPDDWQGEPGITGKLVQSRVTDKGGRHYFLMEPGRYRLTAFKSGFDFPSDILSGAKDDGDYLDVYHGEPINVNEKDVTIAVNIPLDPSQEAEYHTPAALTRRARLRKLQGAVAMIGILFSIVFAVIRPTVFSVVMVGVQILFYLLVRRLATPRKPKSWGIVYDQATGRPLAHAIARVFEPKYNKLLETTVTDSKGRYSFLLGPNEYYTAYQKPGYESLEIRPIDYRAHSEPSEFSADVQLQPTGSGTSSQESSGMTPEPSADAPTASV